MREVIYSVKKQNWNKEPSYIMVNRDGTIALTDDIRCATSFPSSDYDMAEEAEKIITKIRAKFSDRFTVTISVDSKVFPSDKSYWEKATLKADDCIV